LVLLLIAATNIASNSGFFVVLMQAIMCHQ